MKKMISLLAAAVLAMPAALPMKADCAERPSKFTASFIQGWYCSEWNESRWSEEFMAARDAGFDSLIIQSVFDIIRSGGTADGASERDPSAYTSTEYRCFYPTSYSPEYNYGDTLECALRAAEKCGIKLWIGTLYDEMWWKYGWGEPDDYFRDWSASNGKSCADIIEEIWERYGEKYGDQIAGWYYPNEIWNIDSACAGTDSGEYAELIGKSIGCSVDMIEKLCPEKPLMISPFYNPEISSSAQYSSFISDIVTVSGLRPVDVYAPQDCGGSGYSEEVIREWIAAQKEAVGGRMRFWVNNECFDKESAPMSIGTLSSNYYSTSDLAEKNILFSWDHYYASDNSLSEEFAGFSMDNIMGDLNRDGVFSIADAVCLQKWLLSTPDAHISDWRLADLCGDGRIDGFDLCMMRSELIRKANENVIIVTDISQLYTAVKNAAPGDVIKLAPGEYDCASKMISSETDGTPEAPITLSALDPDAPPVLKGNTTEHGYVLHILGDHWVLDGLVCTNSQKGIVLDNSNHTVIKNCELHTLGAEAVAVRDGSSYCTVKGCYIHDTGLRSPGYGEGVYIGSAKSTTGFDYKCDHNKVVDCIFKNVAAEHIDVKEYTTDTEICGCTFYGDGMTGENYAGSFIDLKGNDCYVHDNVGYRNKNPKIVAAFEVHEQAEGWGYHHVFENNTLYMDQPYGAENTSRRMYVVDGWFSDFSVKDNRVDYGEGLVSADSWEYYNSDHVTYLK